MSFIPFTFTTNTEHFGQILHTMDESQVSDAIETILGQLPKYVRKDFDLTVYNFIEHCLRNYSLNLMNDSKKGNIYQNCSCEKLGMTDCHMRGKVGDYYSKETGLHYEHKWTGEAQKNYSNMAGSWNFYGFTLDDTYEFVHLRVEDQHRFFELPYDDQFKNYLSKMQNSNKKKLTVCLGGRTPLYKYIMEHERNDLAKLIWPEIPEVQNRPDLQDEDFLKEND